MVNGRNTAFDMLKLIACYCVLVNHTNSDIFLNLYPSSTGIISLLLFILSKIGVPIFFMISGALLLKDSESYKDWFHKRIIRFAVLLIGISIIAYAIFYGTFDIIHFVQKIIKEPIMMPYWYLYTYIALMLALPFLRKMVQSFANQDFKVYFLITLIVGILYPFLSFIFEFPETSCYFITTIFCGPLFYFILGHYLINIYCIKEKFSPKKENTIGILLFISSVCFFFLWTTIEFNNSGKFLLGMDNLYYLPIICMSVSFFYLFYRNIENRQYTKGNNFITKASAYTFGIYLFHPIFLSIPQIQSMYITLYHTMNTIPACFFYQIIIVLFCVITTFLCKRIPYLKKII